MRKKDLVALGVVLAAYLLVRWLLTRRGATSQIPVVGGIWA